MLATPTWLSTERVQGWRHSAPRRRATPGEFIVFWGACCSLCQWFRWLPLLGFLIDVLEHLFLCIAEFRGGLLAFLLFWHGPVVYHLQDLRSLVVAEQFKLTLRTYHLESATQ